MINTSTVGYRKTEININGLNNQNNYKNKKKVNDIV